MYDIIIIGGGPAGIYGTYYAAFNGLKVLLIEIDEEVGGKPLKLYAQKPIHDFPGLIDITGENLIINLLEQLNTIKDKSLFEIKTKTDISCIKNQNDLFVLKDTNNNIYKSKYLIFSTGYSSFKFKSIDQEKIKTKNKINFHVNNVEKFLNKKVAIFGGGDSAIDYANLIANVAKEICLIHRSNNFKAHKASFKKACDNKKIKIYANHNVEKIEDNDIFLINNDNNKILSLNYDELIICYGIEMIHNNLSKTGVLNKIFKLEVNEKCESINQKNLYGVGNINNKKNKDLILISITEIVQVIIDIMDKEHIQIFHKQ